jgi:hypothetical protein
VAVNDGIFLVCWDVGVPGRLGNPILLDVGVWGIGEQDPNGGDRLPVLSPGGTRLGEMRRGLGDWSPITFGFLELFSASCRA